MHGKDKSPYEILGVDKTATTKEIQSAYRKLAREYHPDVNPDNPESEERFKEIAEAYSILNDPKKRSDYDQGFIDSRGEPRNQGMNFDGHFPWDNPFEFMSHFHFNHHQVRNSNVSIRQEVDASKLFEKHSSQIQYQRTVACDQCNSSGGNGNRQQCNSCNGIGRRVMVSQHGNARIQQDMGPCQYCKGRGYSFEENCENCNGIGLKTTHKSITIDIPANCAYTSLVVGGQGHQESLEIPAGDLIITIVPKSKYCQFDGYAAVYELLIDPIRAMLGCKARAHGLKQKEELLIDIPKMTKPNTHITLKEKGLCDMQGRRHDAHVVVVYKMPDSLSEKQEQLLKDYLESSEVPQEKQQ